METFQCGDRVQYRDQVYNRDGVEAGTVTHLPGDPGFEGGWQHYVVVEFDTGEQRWVAESLLVKIGE